LEAVCNAIKDFLEALLFHLADEQTSNLVLLRIIEPAVEKRYLSVKEKLEELLRSHREFDSIDPNPQFPRKIWSLRERKLTQAVMGAIRQGSGELSTSKDPLPSVEEILTRISPSNLSTDDKYGSNEACEYMGAYYEVGLLF